MTPDHEIQLIGFEVLSIKSCDGSLYSPFAYYYQCLLTLTGRSESYYLGKIKH